MEIITTIMFSLRHLPDNRTTSGHRPHPNGLADPTPRQHPWQVRAGHWRAVGAADTMIW